MEKVVVVVGAGVAGGSAALTLRRHGLPVMLIDEQALPGGQILRAPSDYARHVVPPNHEFADGDRLRNRLNVSGIDLRANTRVWSVSAGETATGVTLDLLSGDHIDRVETDTLVVAGGALERHLPFPGWTDPRITGLAGASILMRNGGVLPGRRMIVAGAGPLLFSVAHQIVELGGEVVAIIDSGRWSDWARLGLALLRDPQRLTLALSWMRRLRRLGVPIHHESHIAAAVSTGSGLSVVVNRTGRGSVTLAADAIACGHGLKPGTAITQALGLPHRHDSAGGYRVPQVDNVGRTGRPGVYVSGDAAGIRGGAVARLRGIVTGHAVAHDLGVIPDRTYRRLVRGPLRRLARLDAVSRRMLPLLNASADLFGAVPDDAIVCRCERLRAKTLREVMQTGAHDLNQIKAWTRCGMGPCQGRMCEDTARGLLASACGVGAEGLDGFTPRIPFFPLPLSALTGDFVYDDIPLPRAAPL